MSGHKSGFIVDGCSVTWENGLAEFHKYGILIRVGLEKFDLAWAVKMNYKLSALTGCHKVSPSN